MAIDRNIAWRSIVGHLATFIAVAEARSFRRAAERIGRSQPAVTAQINQLEEMLGASLLIRTTRQVQLTPLGDELLGRAKQLVNEAEQLVRDFRDREEAERQRMAVSVSPTVASGLMAGCLAAFEPAHPDVTVSIREDLGPEMVEALESGLVDFGIGPYSDVPARLEFAPLFRQTFYLIVRRDHPICAADQIRLADLEGLDLMCPAQGTTARMVLDEAAEHMGVVIRPRYETSQYHTLINLVTAGLGVTVMPMTSRIFLDVLGLKALSFADVDLQRDVGLLTRRDRTLMPVARDFIDILIRQAN